MADVIRAVGLPYVSLNPGSSFRGLHDSLVNHAGNQVEMICCPHEKVAVGLAHGYAKASGRPMAVILHDVVGLLHGAMGIYYALLDRVPVLVLGGSGRILLGATIGYGLACVLFAHAGMFWLALAAALLLGLADALATTIRHAAVQLETPDELRGRVQGFYQMSSRGGPAIGDVNVGWLASILGPVTALTLGGLVSVALAGWFLVRGPTVRDYEVARPAVV